MNPVIIIPAYNPLDTFKNLISSIYKICPLPIIVVDDGSMPSIQLEHQNLILIRNINNIGKGYSLNKAFHYAHDKGYTHAVTMDADFQHDPQMLGTFLGIKKDVAIVIGKRDYNNNMPIHRQLSNKITSLIISYICGKKVYDSQCGYRRYKLSNICSENFIENGFQFETEVLIKLLSRKNCTLHQIKIPTIYDKEISSMNNILDTFKFIRLIFRYFLEHKAYF